MTTISVDSGLLSSFRNYVNHCYINKGHMRNAGNEANQHDVVMWQFKERVISWSFLSKIPPAHKSSQTKQSSTESSRRKKNPKDKLSRKLDQSDSFVFYAKNKLVFLLQRYRGRGDEKHVVLRLDNETTASLLDPSLDFFSEMTWKPLAVFLDYLFFLSSLQLTSSLLLYPTAFYEHKNRMTNIL